MRGKRWVLVLGLLIACAPELTDRERMVERQMVEDRLNMWVRVINNAQMDSLWVLYHGGDDLRVMWPVGRQTRGFEETQQAWREFYESIDYMNFVLQGKAVEVLGRTAALTSFRHSTDIVRSGRRQPVRAGYGVVIWKKDDESGEWKIHLSQISYDAPDS